MNIYQHVGEEKLVHTFLSKKINLGKRVKLIDCCVHKVL